MLTLLHLQVFFKWHNIFASKSGKQKKINRYKKGMPEAVKVHKETLSTL